jgi:predicted Zn-dependent peptidase
VWAGGSGVRNGEPGYRPANGAAGPGPVDTMGDVGVFQRQTLSNGIRVLTAPMPHAQSVSCFLMFAAGSRYETPETNGIAHFAEHMFFKGTERRPTARLIAGEIDGIGGEFNAFTGKEYTGYYVKCAAEHRDVALDVLVDMLRNSRFDGDEIEREKGVIVEEMNMYMDTPRDYIGAVYESLLYGDQPLGWQVIGRKETVRAATPGTFHSYLDRWYRPERMVIGVGGKIGDGLLERLEELVGDLEVRETGAAQPVSIPENGSPVKLHTKSSDQAHVILGARSYPLGHPDRYALQLLSTVLGGGMSSRLFTEVRERRGLAYYVFAGNHAYTDTGSLATQAGVDLKRVDDAVTTIVAELRTIAAEPVPAEELEKARSFTKGRFALQLESPHGTIMFGLRREVLEGAAEEPEAVVAGLDAVTAEDVQRVAKHVIGDDELFLALIGPFDDAAHFEQLIAA